MGVFLLLSCSGNSKGQKGAGATVAELPKAKEVVTYYSTSLEVLRDLVNEKEINALLTHMNLKGKNVEVPAIIQPIISSKDSAMVMNPHTCFNAETRQMSSDPLSILNLYTGRHTMRDARIDHDITELAKELQLAKRLPAVPDHAKEMKDYDQFLSHVEAFLKILPEVRQDGSYTESAYDKLHNAYSAATD